MKIRYYYYKLSSPKNEIRPAISYTLHAAELLYAPASAEKAYSKYILSSLDSDFFENRHGDCDLVLTEIARLEKGELDNFVFEFDGFIHYVGRDSVTFEHAIFGVCSHWPLWSCPLSHYKIAVQAARDFFAMPVSLDTELIVELPESDMAQIAIFPPKMPYKEDAFDLEHD